MKALKYSSIYVALVVAIYAWNAFTDWLNPILDRSPIFNGIMVCTGVATLPLWVLLIKIPDQRPFSPDARFPRLLVKVELFAVSASLILYGLRYWLPGLEPAAMVLLALLLVSSALLVFLLLRADKQQAAKTRAPDAAQPGKPDGA